MANLKPEVSAVLRRIAFSECVTNTLVEEAQAESEAAVSGAAAAIPNTIRTITVNANDQQLEVTDVSTAYCTPDANRTGLILAFGFEGQRLVIINQSASFSMTFAASGTSLVANGVSSVIPPNTAREFAWSSYTSLWYPCI